MVLKVVAGQLTVTEAAEQYGLSRRQLQRLLARYRQGGLGAVDPQSRRPKSNPRSTPPEVIERIVQLRSELVGHGLDAGPVTIGWHLDREGLQAPSKATIHRILTRAGLVVPEPRKRPAVPTSGSRPRNRTKPGSPTSPTGASRTAPTWRS